MLLHPFFSPRFLDSEWRFMFITTPPPSPVTAAGSSLAGTCLTSESLTYLCSQMFVMRSIDPTAGPPPTQN
jgi:hypothetical protein